ncbi:MAG: glycoside hydrolase family 2 TIM barrel-domain containing protein [Bacteroidota bacterium]
MIKHILRTIIACLLLCNTLLAQSRVVQSINTNWAFHKGDVAGMPSAAAKTDWEKVSIPHSWNTTDVYDDAPGYYRGIGWYKKTVYIPSAWKSKNIYLHFEGANQVAEVYVNGKSVGKHIGGYTAFSFPINQYLLTNDSLAANEIAVKVDNSNNADIPPLSADFTFYGGLYRDVYLVAANPVHFEMDDNASPGIRIKTPSVTDSKAGVVIEGSISNTSTQKRNLKVVSELIDAQGKLLGKTEQKLSANASGKQIFSQQQTVMQPHLWSPEDPYLYHIITRVYDAKTNEVLDEQTNPLGLRWFSFDADKGFFLNGKPVKLMGANRHQDFRDLGNALPNALHERDMQLLKSMGANFIRIAHYPQDPAVLEACDRLGIMASVEIPIVNEITESAAFSANCLAMQTDMIRQNFNHPSVIIWAYMNEVMLKPHFQSGSDRQKAYFASIVTLAKSIDSLSRAEDPSRYTMIPCHGSYNLYTSTGLTKVPQIVGWNLYSGWYSAGLNGFEAFLDNFHKNTPDKPVMVTEYGADADSRSHSLNPERFDKSVEYEVIYHAHYIKQMMNRPFVAGAAIWNLVDFNSEGRAESTPHINTKGITTDVREPKETYFLYQANLLKTPFIQIGGNQWKLRSGISTNGITCTQPVTVFSNQVAVQLWLNGQSLGTANVQDGMAVFKVPFKNGTNQLKATAAGTATEDNQVVTFKAIPALLTDTKLPFTEINVSLGDVRYFVDDKLQQIWLPEQAYTKDSWGYVGGEPLKSGGGRTSMGSDKDIFGTNYDPIYETQRIGIEAFKADVPDGQYEVTLHFAELQAKSNGELLVYNLGSDTRQGTTVKSRVFNVLVNGQPFINGLSNSNYLEAQTAYSATTVVTVQNGQGITADFKPIAGQTILNAVQIKKIY